MMRDIFPVHSLEKMLFQNGPKSRTSLEMTEGICCLRLCLFCYAGKEDRWDTILFLLYFFKTIGNTLLTVRTHGPVQAE